jgi:capsid protein
MNIVQRGLLRLSGVTDAELIDNSPLYKSKIEEIESKAEEFENKFDEVVQKISANRSGGSWGQSYSVSFNGEKNIGEIGPIINYQLDHLRLAQRSWQSFLENDISKTVLKKFTLWIIDKGLKLQANPLQVVLKSEGININVESFNEIAEARWLVWSKSKNSSHSKNNNLNDLAKEAFKHAKIGGDVLVLLRYDIELKSVTIQLIDTCHLLSPLGSETTEAGNKVVDGVEIDKNTGEHIAFHVRKKGTFETERIPAMSETLGIKTAFLVYGDKYRMDNQRGTPIIATSLETLKKIERYKEAAVGSAEERQKIVYQIVHDIGSSGESPLVDQLTRAFDLDSSGSNIPADATGQQMANNIAVSTSKQTFNMAQGSEIKPLESKNEMFFAEFYSTNANIICAAIGIPPNVAFSLYNDSFSASRAATKDWEHTIEVERDYFNSQFYVPIYAFWLFIEVYNNKISAPGYLDAWYKKNWMVNESYNNARFTGPMFPHIDPLKEVNAERAKLGELAAGIPLTTVEQATEVLNGGDSDSNALQFSEELKTAEKLGLKVNQTPAPEPTQAPEI